MKSNFPCEKERQRRLNEFLWLLDVNAGLNHRDSEPIEFEEGKMPLAQVVSRFAQY
jgi:hypothetical protein